MATNHTEHYRLNLWEPTDYFLREEFNENFQKTDAAVGCKFGTDNMPWVVGAYTGDGTDEREIKLGFQPTFLFVLGALTCHLGFAISTGGEYIAHGMVGEGRTAPDACLDLTDKGFKVKVVKYGTEHYYLNTKDRRYIYFAIR